MASNIPRAFIARRYLERCNHLQDRLGGLNDLKFAKTALKAGQAPVRSAVF